MIYIFNIWIMYYAERAEDVSLYKNKKIKLRMKNDSLESGGKWKLVTSVSAGRERQNLLLCQ